MKFLLTKLFIINVFVFILPGFLFAEKISSSYNIELGKIELGSLKWELVLNNNEYEIFISLSNNSLLSALYEFSGEYYSKGKIFNGQYMPSEYKQLWKTKKKLKEVKIIFKKSMVFSLNQNPQEKEHARIDFLNIVGLADPLSSFMNILLNNKNSFSTIDGRWVYKMSVNVHQKNDNYIFKKITIKDYSNIWTDHKKLMIGVIVVIILLAIA